MEQPPLASDGPGGTGVMGGPRSRAAYPLDTRSALAHPVYQPPAGAVAGPVEAPSLVLGFARVTEGGGTTTRNETPVIVHPSAGIYEVTFEKARKSSPNPLLLAAEAAGATATITANTGTGFIVEWRVAAALTNVNWTYIVLSSALVAG